MSSVQEVIIECAQILRNDPERANTVTETLLEIYDNLENLPDLFTIIQTVEDEYVRNLTIIGIKNIVRSHLKNQDMPEELLNFVKQAIVEGLQLEIGENSKLWYCIIAGEILDAIPSSDYPEIIELATGFVHDPLQISTGLLLWTQICRSFNPEQIDAHMELFIELITTILNGDNGNFRVFAMQLFLNILQRGASFDAMAQNSEFQAALQSAFNRAVNDPNVTDSERSQVIGTLSQAVRFDAYFDAIEPSFPQLYHITLDGFDNENLSPMTRLETLDFFNGVIEAKPMFAESILEDIVVKAVPLTVEQCRLEGRENFEPHLSDVTFQILASDENLADDLISNVLALAQETIEADDVDFVQLQVLIQFFGPLANGAQDMIVPYEPDITPIFQAALTDGDEPLIAATCLTLSEISENAPSFFHAQFNSYFELLIQYADQQETLPTLETLLTNAESPIAAATDICSALMQVPESFESYNINNVIKCISACVSNTNQKSVDPELYTAIKEFLLAQLESEAETNETVYECFSQCSQIAPQQVLEDLPSLFEGMISLVTEETMQFIESVSEAMQNFAYFYSTSIQEFVPQCGEALIPFLVNDTKQTNAMSDETAIEQEEMRESNLQGAILKCLSAFIASAPEQSEEFTEPVMTMICDWLTADSEEENKIFFAADALADLAPGLRSIDVDPNPLFMNLMSALKSQIDVKLMNNLFIALSALQVNVAERLSDDSLQQLLQFFVDVLTGEAAECVDEDGQLDRDLQGAFFFALKSFFLSGIVSRIDPTQLIENLHAKLALTDHLQLLSLSLLALSRFSHINTEGTGEIAQQCAQTIAEVLSQDDVRVSADIRSNLYSAVCYITISHIDVFTQEIVEVIAEKVIEDISEETQNTLKENASLALMCLAANGIEIDAEKLQEAVEAMSPMYDEEDAALFALASVRLASSFPGIVAKAAVSLLASQDWVLNDVPQDVVASLVENVKTFPEEKIGEMLNYSEGPINRLKSRLA